MLTQTFDNDATAHSRLRIGDWWADPATNELSRGGETARIEPKAMEVLLLLAGRSGRVVSREELFSAVWPGVVVGDEALTQSINKLRKALGDNARAASYIETISKRGYRLIAPVRQGEALPPTGDGVELAAPPRRPVRTRWLSAGVLGALVVAALYFFHSVPRSTSDPDPADIRDERQQASLSVTVLPFESLGAGGEQGYLARGIGDDLRTDLSRLPGVRLIRASSAAPDSKTARSARYLVSGSVQREAETLRINIHLIDTSTNQQLWSERFERPFGDLFAVQNEISRKLTELLPGKLADAARQRLAKRYTRSLQAYDYFLRGQALFLARQTADNEEARGAYRKALELDPNFARAYAGLAMTYAMDYRLRPSGGSSPALGRASLLAETARLIDPDIAEVHWALGFVHAQSRRHEQAMASLQRAIELNRSFADAYALLGGIYTYIGQPSKSIPLLRTAMRLHPDGGYLYFLLLGRAYLFENDIEQAQINLREASARNPADLETRVFIVAAAMAMGDRFAAEWEAEEIRALEVGFSTHAWLDTYPLTSTRHREAGRAARGGRAVERACPRPCFAACTVYINSMQDHAPTPATMMLAPRKGRGTVWAIEHRFTHDSHESFDDGWGTLQQAAHEETLAPETRIVEQRVKSILAANQSPDIHFDLSINPYRGCEHGCIYCFARPTHSYLDLSPGLDFETRIIAKVNAAERLREAFAHKGYEPMLLNIGSATDAYQPIERKLRITRGVIEVLAEHRHAFSLVTKSSGVERDLDLIAPMAADKLAAVYVSVTSLDPALARIMEPRAAAPQRRLRTIETLAKAGVPVGVSVSPIIPFINEPEIERVLEAARDAGATRGFGIVLRLPWEVNPLFQQWLLQHFPDRAGRVMARIRELRGGRDNDARFGTRFTGTGVWARLIAQRLQKALDRFGYSADRFPLDLTKFRRPQPPVDAAQASLF